LGATIVGPDAGNMISEITVAMRAGMGLGALASVIHPYHTQVCTSSAVTAESDYARPALRYGIDLRLAALGWWFRQGRFCVAMGTP